MALILLDERRDAETQREETQRGSRACADLGLWHGLPARVLRFIGKTRAGSPCHMGSSVLWFFPLSLSASLCSFLLLAFIGSIGGGCASDKSVMQKANA